VGDTFNSAAQPQHQPELIYKQAGSPVAGPGLTQQRLFCFTALNEERTAVLGREQAALIIMHLDSGASA